jgi:hypothetical protein
MTFHSIFLAPLVFMQVAALIWAAVALKGARLKTVFILFGVCLLVANLVAALPGWPDLGGSWVGALGYIALLAVHPLAAGCVLAVLRDYWGRRRTLFISLAVVSMLPAMATGIALGWGPDAVYATYPVSIIPAMWLAFALAESIATWLHSSLKGEAAFACIVGMILLIVSGPVYSLELESVGWEHALGVIPAAPLAFAAFLWSAWKANPLTFKRPLVIANAHPPDGLQAGLHLLDEARPKYAAELVKRRARAGMPTWVFVRSESEDAKHRYGNAQLLKIPSSQHCALKVVKTIMLISREYPQSVFLIEDLSCLVCNSGLMESLEAMKAVSNHSRMNHCVTLASLSCLTRAEVREFAGLPAYYWKLPVVEEEIAAILHMELGPASHHMLRIFCNSKKMRMEDMMMYHILDLQEFLKRILTSLSRNPGDSKVLDSGLSQVGAIVSKLDRFRSITLDDLAKGPWPSASVTRRDKHGWLVKATDFGFGTGLGENASHYGGRARGAFEEALGEGGRALYEQTLQILGLDEKDIEPEDFPALYKTTEELLKLLESHESALRKVDKMLERSSELKEWLEVVGGSMNG